MHDFTVRPANAIMHGGTHYISVDRAVTINERLFSEYVWIGCVSSIKIWKGIQKYLSGKGFMLVWKGVDKLFKITREQK